VCGRFTLTERDVGLLRARFAIAQPDEPVAEALGRANV